MKSRAPQLHLEYRFYKVLGNAGKSYLVIHESLKKLSSLSRKVDIWCAGSGKYEVILCISFERAVDREKH